MKMYDAARADRLREQEENKSPEVKQREFKEKYGPEIQVMKKEWRGNVLVTLDGAQWKPQDASIKDASHGENGVVREFILVHRVQRGGKTVLIENPETSYERVWVLARPSEHVLAEARTDERSKLLELLDQRAAAKRAA
ncbi:hypothetical protein EXS70_02180 [Candidatus Peribacteria bacterium]|nr:hypothetical protein [Candidatus Peribacteria bacterium]